MTTATAPIRILLLDDDPFMLKLLTHMLADAGQASVKSFDTGQAALTHIVQHAPELIFCDLNMPGMDGIEFVRKLMEYGYTGNLVLISGEEERILQAAERLVQAHQITVLGRLKKPVSPAELAVLLEAHTRAAPARRGMAASAYDVVALRDAIARCELINYYQPKVETRTGRLVGVETLVRWQHPRDGLVGPASFIGLAEENGLIDELTRCVLSGALQQARTWREAGLKLRLAVNVSMDNLASLDFTAFVTDLAAEHGLAPGDITLEVTESRLATDLRAPLEILTRLRLKRFNISLDDFGTGNSSLVQLRDMPFNELKIDQGFVHKAHDNHTLSAMYAASMDLARKLNMATVAEGVEDLADWHYVCRSGCDLVQGYFVARPMPAAALPAWVALWEERLVSEGLLPEQLARLSDR